MHMHGILSIKLQVLNIPVHC